MKQLLLFCLFSIAFLPSLAQENIKTSRPFIKEYQYDSIDVAPQFPGGESAMVLFLKGHTQSINLKNKPEGISYINFIVTKEGNIQDIRVIKSLEPALDQAAIEMIKQMPRWKPALRKGQIIESRWTVPVLFSTENQQKTKIKSKRKQ